MKRDGRIVVFDQTRITSAVSRAMEASGEGDLRRDPGVVSGRVVRELFKKFDAKGRPHIEDIQDAVEESLILLDFPKTAKAYILYRNERARVREKRTTVPERIRRLADESKQYFRNPLGEFVYYRSYSRWIETEGRRETWVETVERYLDFMRENLGDALTAEEYAAAHRSILRHEVMPSMRLMWSAGEAARRTNVAAYNCSYIAPSKLGDFAEIMYLLMCGTGVGFSVESQTVQQLPIVARQTRRSSARHVIEDSREGWANALTLGLRTWYGGGDVEFDYSQLRPAGARLKTMGGRSSGPEPLKHLLTWVRTKILARQGRRLSNLDVHDLICNVGGVVVAGGVRRSALISLSDLDDVEMRDAKKGQFYLSHPHRAMANNSAVYVEKPSAATFLDEWLALAKSGSGERGIFNRGGLDRQMPERRWRALGSHKATVGTNPCGEIVLRNKQFCNLTEVVARHDDTKESLRDKVRIAAILGTYQSTLTDFPYLSKDWERNCKEERLLGVSITGQWDAPALRDAETFRTLREEAIAVNRRYAKRFGINPSASVTCVKPSGTVSQLVDAASGMHPRHAPYYVRRVRISATDPLFQMLRDQKFPYHPEVGQEEGSANTYVLEFPVKAPGDSVYRNDHSVLEQLEYWKTVKENFTEHNPSVTISVGEDEWIETADWLYRHWDILGGLSFLPREEHVYALAPFEEISKERYEELVCALPQIDFSSIVAYEQEDHTEGSKELACVAGVCEVESIAAETAVVAV